MQRKRVWAYAYTGFHMPIGPGSLIKETPCIFQVFENRAWYVIVLTPATMSYVQNLECVRVCTKAGFCESTDKICARGRVRDVTGRGFNDGNNPPGEAIFELESIEDVPQESRSANRFPTSSFELLMNYHDEAILRDRLGYRMATFFDPVTNARTTHR